MAIWRRTSQVRRLLFYGNLAAHFSSSPSPILWQFGGALLKFAVSYFMAIWRRTSQVRHLLFHGNSEANHIVDNALEYCVAIFVGGKANGAMEFRIGVTNLNRGLGALFDRGHLSQID
jgi:hypothetical protein